jgi:hypothetical protein
MIHACLRNFLFQRSHKKLKDGSMNSQDNHRMKGALQLAIGMLWQTG